MRLRTCLAAALCGPALVLGASACGSSAGSTGSTSSTSPTSVHSAGPSSDAASPDLGSSSSELAPGATPAASSDPVPAPTLVALSKKAFLSQTNAVCKAETAKLKALDLAKATDYAALATATSGGMQVETEYLQQVTRLVRESPDAATLTAKWIDVATSDYTLAQPLLVQLIAAAQAHNDDQINAISSQIAATPDHSKTMAAYLKGYGLSECATFQTS